MNLIELKNMCSKFTVLYAEDDKDIRENSEKIFKNFFKDVVCAEDGKYALQEYKKQEFDLVITDILMPRLNGIELLDEIKKINPDQTCIVISAYDESHYLLDLIKIGLDGYVIKPFNIDSLLNVFTKVVKNLNLKLENSNYKYNLESLVSEQTRMIEKKAIELVQSSYHDPLTGLLNYIHLNKVLDEEQTIFFLNVDRFSHINSAYGVTYGDKLLKEISRELLKIINQDMKLYRYSSDQFVILSPTMTHNESIEFLDKFYSNFKKRKFDLGIFKTNVSFSIGIASGKGTDAILNTQIALKEIKNIKSNTYNFYDENSPFLKQQALTFEWVKKIEDVFDKGQFELFYQPLYNIATQKIDKYECLIRIKKDEQIISPFEFLDAIKYTSNMIRLTKIIIEKACQKFTGLNVGFSINITQEDFEAFYLEKYLVTICDKYNIDYSLVTLEALENISDYKYEDSLKQLKNLQKIGFKIALDDFGTEDSNFSRLLNLEPDFIKIDGSFIKNILDDKHSLKIVETMKSFSHDIGSIVIAEFVYSKDVLEKIKEIGIDYAQGYEIGKPSSELL